MSLKSTFAAIHRVNAEPEVKFAAAMVASAAEQARSGDCEAYAWLERCSLRWLYAITPAGDSCERIREALLATIPEPVCPAGDFGHPMVAGIPHGGHGPSSETEGFVQLFMTGMEASHGDGNRLPEMRVCETALARGDPVWHLETQALPGL